MFLQDIFEIDQFSPTSADKTSEFMGALSMGVRQRSIVTSLIATTAAAMVSSCGGGLPSMDLGTTTTKNSNQWGQPLQYSNLDQLLPEGNFIEAIYDVKASSGILVNCKIGRAHV